MTRAPLLAIAAVSVVAASLAGACGGKAAQPAATGPATAAAADRGAAAAALPVFPEEPFRAAQPAAAPPRDFHLPEMAHFVLGERDPIDVYLVERHDLPTISIDLNVDGGAMLDPPGKVGLASVCMDLLAEGTVELDKIAFREALADVASNVSSYAGEDRQGVAMSTLTRSFDATFALFVDTITQPGMRQADLDRLIKRRLEGLKQARGSAESVAGRLDQMMVYGLDHPLGRVPTEKTLGAVRMADCKRHVRRYLEPRGARLFVVGDTTEADVRRSFAPLLARWRGAPARAARPPRPRPPAGRIFFVHIPGSAQSSVSMLHAGPPRLAPDYFATMLLAQVLGRGFSSRINMNLREDKGYSYGAGGGFAYNRFFGRFSARSSVRSDATYQSLIELRREVVAMQDGSRPATADELARDKEGTILGLPASFDTAGAAIDQYRALVYFGLPPDYFNGYVDQVRAVTADELKKAAAEHLRPDEARFLVVGDGDAPQIAHHKGDGGQKGEDRPLVDEAGVQLTLRAALSKLAADRALGDGKLVELDADGKIVRPESA
ncbi:MAG TPA: pitrilysin family protein, partial [Kofleriaceae bacterium]|nr:pitrilysin family protein [Kofleriaceae bacterium]